MFNLHRLTPAPQSAALAAADLEMGPALRASRVKLFKPLRRNGVVEGGRDALIAPNLYSTANSSTSERGLVELRCAVICAAACGAGVVWGAKRISCGVAPPTPTLLSDLSKHVRREFHVMQADVI